MPDSRTSNATMFDAAREFQAAGFKNFTILTTHSLNVTYGLWSRLVRNQQELASNLLDAMAASGTAGRISRYPNPPVVGGQRSGANVEVSAEAVADSPPRVRNASRKVAPVGPPIKRYDELTVPEIVGKLNRSRDIAQVQAVLAYEAKNKSRKGVAVAGKACLARLRVHTDH